MEAFLSELNEAISPLMVAEKDENVFRVRLASTPYLRQSCLNVTPQFTALVSEIGDRHFGKKPRFNNTETTWWF